jgi:hypothetical protein
VGALAVDWVGTPGGRAGVSRGDVLTAPVDASAVDRADTPGERMGALAVDWVGAPDGCAGVIEWTR